MIIPDRCKDIINRDRLNQCFEPNLAGLSLKQQVTYLEGCCSYMADIILAMIHLLRKMDTESLSHHPLTKSLESQTPDRKASGGSAVAEDVELVDNRRVHEAGR